MSDIALDNGDLSAVNEAALRAGGGVAWDIETTGLDWSSDKIATSQLHSRVAGTVIVQGLSCLPQRLRGLLADTSVLKIFHHAPFDLRFMAKHWNVAPARVACTKVASRLLNPELPTGDHSLKPLLIRHLGIEIDKSEQLSNWMAPELTVRQLTYAAADVEHLIALHAELEKQLRDRGLEEIYRACCEFIPTRVALEIGHWPDVFAY